MMKKPTGDQIKALREETGYGLMQCKKHFEKKYLKEAINDLPFASVELKQILLKIVELSVHDSLTDY